MKDHVLKTMSLMAVASALVTTATIQAAVVDIGTDVGSGADAGLYNDDGFVGQAFADTSNLSIYSMDIRLLTDGSLTQRFRAGIIRLDLSSITKDFSNLLNAGIKIQNASQQREMIIYGLNDGDAEESWDEGTITWNTTPGLTPNPTYDPVLTTDGQVDTLRWTELGYWTPMGPGSGGTTTEFSTTYLSTENPAGWTDDEAAFADEYGEVDPNFNSNLVSFLQADTDGQVSLLFMISERLGPANGGSVGIRTKEWVLANSGLTTPSIVMEFADGSLEGDLNGDGFVGLDDLDIVLGAWNQNVPPADPAADPSGDGFVGLDDLDVVLNNWNAGTPPVTSTVPEPTGITLLGLGGLVMFIRQRSTWIV